MSYLDDFLDGPSASAPAGFKPVVTEQGRKRHPVDKIDPRLYQIMTVAASQSPYEVRFDSGYREGDKRQHGKHNALDIELWDKRTGKKLADYQNPAYFREYEKFAQTARAVQQQLYPELDKAFRWGGYFSGKKNYGALDLMHFDIGGGKGLGMLGGSWEGGLTDKQRKLWRGIVSEGMGSSRGQGLQQAMGPRVSNLRRDMRQYYGGSQIDAFLGNDSPAVSASAPRGIRNNNPTNIDYNPKIPWEGQEGIEPAPGKGNPRFIKFYTPEYGIRAATKNIMAKQRKGANTLERLVSIWAPPKENDTEAYIRRMSEMTGYGRADPLDLSNRDTLRKLVPAFIQHENGQNPYTADQIDAGVDAALGLRKLGRAAPASTPAPTAAPTRTASSDSFLSAFLDN